MFYDKERNVAVYKVANCKAVVDNLPGSKDLGDNHVGIPCTLENLQILSKIGVPTISILDHAYDWPHGPSIEKPHTAQKLTANFLIQNPRCFNLSEMRTGKTLSSLWAADYLINYHKEQGEDFKVLIIAPYRTLTRTWATSIFSHFMNRRTSIVLDGSAKKREELLSKDVDFYIVNFEGLGIGATCDRKLQLGGLSKCLHERDDIKLIIVDEGSAYKDPSTQRHKIARSLFDKKPYVWLMTGTPTPSGPLDAYGQAKLVNNAHNETYTAYKNRIMNRVGTFKWVSKPGAMEAARKLLTPSIRFTQEDCFDSPDCVVMKEDTELSPTQVKAYDRMKKEFHLQIEDGKHISAVNEGVLRWKLIQIACGAVYGANKEVHLVDAKPRIKVVKEIIESAPKKVIVFAPLTSVVNLLYSELSKHFKCMVVNGELSGKESDKRLSDFQVGTPKVLIAHPGPIARGLDLTAAATIVWFAPTDKTEDYIQANQRINGPHQTHKRTIVQIAASPIEREIYNRLEKNESLQGVMLKLIEEDKE